MKPPIEIANPPKMIITDGAGTLFDPGSRLPAKAMKRAFEVYGVPVSIETIMRYMGMKKKEHVQFILTEVEVSRRFQENFNRPPLRADVNKIYNSFKEELYNLASQTEEIPRVKEQAYRLKEAGIPLVMTTGYNKKMTDLIRRRHSWLDEVVGRFVTNSEVKVGRPFPYMLWRALEWALIDSPTAALKVGDTKVDVQAADKTHMPSIMVLSGSITSREDAQAINTDLHRDHLIYDSLADVIEDVIAGTLADKINGRASSRSLKPS